MECRGIRSDFLQNALLFPPSFADVLFWFLVLPTDEKCLTAVAETQLESDKRPG